jgi:predicted membrane-bound spermidine synthase
MNTKKILSVAAFAVLGLLVGYVFFGKWAGDYVSVKTLFSFGGNSIQSAFRSISGIEEMRNKILICGVIGALVGLLIPFKLNK